MDNNQRIRRMGAGLLALTWLGCLAAGPSIARADDPTPKGDGAGKKEKKQDIPIKIVPPIIVPDKGKSDKGGKQGK